MLLQTLVKKKLAVQPHDIYVGATHTHGYIYNSLLVTIINNYTNARVDFYLSWTHDLLRPCVDAWIVGRRFLISSSAARVYTYRIKI